MRKQLLAAVLSVSFVGAPLMMGCDDKEISKEKTVKTDPNTGKTSVDEKKVEKTAEGGTKTTEEHKVDVPAK